MSNINGFLFRRNRVFHPLILFVFLGLTAPAQARDLNAGFVLNEMNAGEQVAYVSGVIEGLAYARFLRDRPDESGMNCVYDWYGKDKKTRWLLIRKWLARHADKPVGPLLYILIRKECGD